MDTADEFSKRIVDTTMIGSTPSQKEEAQKRVKLLVHYHVNDILALVKNINDTSVNRKDKQERFAEGADQSS